MVYFFIRSNLAGKNSALTSENSAGYEQMYFSYSAKNGSKYTKMQYTLSRCVLTYSDHSPLKRFLSARRVGIWAPWTKRPNFKRIIAAGNSCAFWAPKLHANISLRILYIQAWNSAHNRLSKGHDGTARSCCSASVVWLKSPKQKFCPYKKRFLKSH